MKCAYVEWVDSVHMENWNDASSLKSVKYEASCGILVQDEPEFVTLALSYAAETNEYGHVISIPRVAIKSIRVFAGGPAKKPRTKKEKAIELLSAAGITDKSGALIPPYTEAKE